MSAGSTSLTRRSLLRGLLGAPAVIAAERLMPVKLWKPPRTIWRIELETPEQQAAWIGNSVHETIMFNRAITDHERRQLEAYLMNKWGIPRSIAFNRLGGHEQAIIAPERGNWIMPNRNTSGQQNKAQQNTQQTAEDQQKAQQEQQRQQIRAQQSSQINSVLQSAGFIQPQQVVEANQTFPDAQAAAVALVNLKSQLFGAGFIVESEEIDGDALVCILRSQASGNSVIITHDVANFEVTVEEGDDGDSDD